MAKRDDIRPPHGGTSDPEHPQPGNSGTHLADRGARVEKANPDLPVDDSTAGDEGVDDPIDEEDAESFEEKETVDDPAQDQDDADPSARDKPPFGDDADLPPRRL